MVTRNPSDTSIPPGECTEFVMHKSQQSISHGIQKKIIDYTEHRLMRYSEQITDPQQKSTIKTLLSDYRIGKVAVAWRRGLPIYIKVTKTT